ncbi:ATP-binding protein [Cytobacillus sp. Hm23]
MKWTIRRKFFLGFCILFTLAAIVVNHVLKTSLETNSHAMIESELGKLQYSSREHIKKFSQLHPTDENLLKKYGSTIAQELSKLYKQSISIYDQEGVFLYEAVPIDRPLLLGNQTFQSNLEANESVSLNQAFNNKSAFSVNHVANGSLVYFSYPLYIQGEFYGVLRFTGDYTELFANNREILKSFTVLTFSLFFGVFIISLLLTNQIIKPLHRLTAATKLMAAGDYSTNVYAKTGDEIEVLTTSFNEMKKKIQGHIEIIEKEKEKVMLLEKSRTTFFNNVTHELKTPLATISGYAQIIGEKDFNDAFFLQKAAKKIRLESNRLNEMVIELLELSKKEADPILKKNEVLHLYPLLSSVCEDMSLKAERQQMKIVLLGDDFVVQGNEDELRQVFINVLDNAIKYGLTEEQIVVSITGETITVVNRSHSIAESIVEHAFEPFVHTQRRGSSGLGLYICKQIILRLNGTISFHYEDGRAITTINLPRWQQNGNNF